MERIITPVIKLFHENVKKKKKIMAHTRLSKYFNRGIRD